MKTLSIREARSALGRLEEILEREGEITITRRGRPIALLRPIPGRHPVPSHQRLWERTGLMDTGSEELVRRDRDGRG